MIRKLAIGLSLSILLSACDDKTEHEGEIPAQVDLSVETISPDAQGIAQAEDESSGVTSVPTPASTEAPVSVATPASPVTDSMTAPSAPVEPLATPAPLPAILPPPRALTAAELALLHPPTANKIQIPYPWGGDALGGFDTKEGRWRGLCLEKSADYLEIDSPSYKEDFFILPAFSPAQVAEITSFDGAALNAGSTTRFEEGRMGIILMARRKYADVRYKNLALKPSYAAMSEDERTNGACGHVYASGELVGAHAFFEFNVNPEVLGNTPEELASRLFAAGVLGKSTSLNQFLAQIEKLQQTISAVKKDFPEFSHGYHYAMQGGNSDKFYDYMKTPIFDFGTWSQDVNEKNAKVIGYYFSPYGH